MTIFISSEALFSLMCSRIHLQGLHHLVELYLPLDGRLLGATINVSPLLRRQLSGVISSIEQRLHQSIHIQEFFLELQELLSSLSTPPPLPSAHRYQELIAEL